VEKVHLPEYYIMYGYQDLDALKPEGISPVERLMNEFESHEAKERSFLPKYKEMAGQTENPLIKFLVQLIIADEEKHHAVLHAMVSTLRGSLTWTEPEDALRGFYEVAKGREELLALTENFIRVEKEGLKEYKELVRTSDRYYHGLFALLLQSMIHDSEKHVEILEFIRKRLRET